jgi:hypothetical protein
MGFLSASINVEAILFIGLLVAGCAVAFVFAVPMYAGVERALGPSRYAGAFYRAVARVMPFLSGGFVAVVLAMEVGRFIGRDDALTPSADGILGGVALAWLAGTVTIALFNRPKMLVPGPLRNRPGMIAEIRSKA